MSFIELTSLNQDIEIKVLDERFKNKEFPLPQYETQDSAGMDLRAMIDADTVIPPNGQLLVPTGIAMYLKNPYLCATVYPRSGLGFKSGIVLGNLTGLIDADYQGQMMLPIWNRSSEPFTLHVGNRVAQMVILPIVRANLKIVEEFDFSERGDKGFGSTGHQ